jgi:hypothetical protein
LTFIDIGKDSSLTDDTEASLDGRPEKKIFFDDWVAVGSSEVTDLVKQLAERDLISAEMKLMLLALGKMNNSGHAVFDPGYLSKHLATVNRSTGEVKPMTRENISKIKRNLARAGLLVNATGGVQCVWVSAGYAQRNRQHGNFRCPFHRTAERWPETDIAA